MKNKLILSCMVAILGAFSAHAAPKFQNIHLIPGNTAIGGKVTLIKTSQRWTADTVYILDRLTFVEAPAVLTIEPGTIIRMEQKTTGGTSVTDPADVGTLIICRGAKIVANGTAESPIIFTNIDDPFVPGGEITIPNRDNGVTDNADYAPYDTVNPANNGYIKRDYTENNRFKYDSTCGGVIILGKTPVAFGNPQLTKTGQLRFNVVNGGAGYEVTQGTNSDEGSYKLSATVTRAAGDSTGTGAAISKLLLNQTGGIKRVVISNGGSYSSATPPTIAFTKANDSNVASEDTVVAPTYTVNMVETPPSSGNWIVGSVTIINSGRGYAAATLAFNGGSEVTKATGTAVIGRSVVQVVASNTGKSYELNPTVGITYTGNPPTTVADVRAEIVEGGVTDPTAVPLSTSGVGANFIEGFQSIDGALFGSAVNYSGSIYGGSDDDDNSGTLHFVSIRYGGFILSPNNEINGLTTGAVGRGTSFEFIEVVNSADDDIEHFGGTVDMKYVACLFGGDDGIDIDQGYRGRIQFAFQIQNNTSGTSRPSGNIGDCLGEWDGPEAPTSSRPYTVHTLFNFTGIGTGASSGKGINYKDNAGGKVFNSIYADAMSGLTLTESGTSTVADNAASTATTAAVRFATTRSDGGVENLLTGTGSAGEPDAMIKYTSYRKIGTATAASDVFKGINTTANWGANLISTATTGTGNRNDFADNLSDFEGIARVNTTGALDPRLKANSTIRNSGVLPSASGGVRAADPFYTQTQLRGAFRDCNWLSGWSLLSEWGLLSNANVAIPAVKLERASGVLTVSFTPTSGVEYVIETSLDGKKFTPFKTVTGGSSDVREALGAGTANSVLFVRCMPL